MTLDKRTRDAMLELCGQLHDDDGVDPREFFKSGRGPRKTDHKAQQLCRQVAETVDQVLSGEMGDDRLIGLRVASVQPAPDASRMLVTVVADWAPDDFCRAEVEGGLHASAGRLRAAVAAAITRRKAPTLAFVVLGPHPQEARHD
ncbi:ribosome-binding factor A [Pirellulimonas nuda]|uniref:Ribosome-binding factor A n=1 Tax=Pirellulimonas nuda TaxID=2528009 RepID=A0A518DFY4_9BACT|nr:ribosome-binding factor A [Pirellulimonas nuda]QDU90342.1 ribosome-binding factor A [Pirellulimonas nuda]